MTEKDAAVDRARRRATSLVNHIEFPSLRQGMLAARERDTSYVRFWDLRQAQQPVNEGFVDGERFRFGFGEPRAASKSWRPWTAAGSGMRVSSVEAQEATALVLSVTPQTKNFQKPLASFALLPSKRDFSLTLEVMVVNIIGDLELYAMKQVSWSVRGNLAIGTGLCFTVAFPHNHGMYTLKKPQQLEGVGILSGSRCLAKVMNMGSWRWKGATRRHRSRSR